MVLLLGTWLNNSGMGLNFENVPIPVFQGTQCNCCCSFSRIVVHPTVLSLSRIRESISLNAQPFFAWMAAINSSQPQKTNYVGIFFTATTKATTKCKTNRHSEDPLRVSPIRDYVHMLKQLGALTIIKVDQHERPPAGPNFFDEETDEDGRAMRSQRQQMGLQEYHHQHFAHSTPPTDQGVGVVPPGYSAVTIAGVECYSNGGKKHGTDWYSDGSKVQARICHYHVKRAAVAVTRGGLKVLARVSGPQCYYRAELVGAVIAAVLADDGDTLVCCG